MPPTASSRPPLSPRVQLLAAALVGVGGALLGFAYLAALHLLEHVLGPHGHDPLLQLALLVGAGLAVGLLTRALGSPGDVELLVDDIHVLDERAQLGRLRALVPVSLLCIASGGAAGPEAPLVQTSGSLARRLAQRLRLDPLDRRTLAIAGMAAAFTVLFGAPLGAALFALEILHRRGLQYHEALLPSVVAALVGYAVYGASSGLGLAPVWRFAPPAEPRALDLLWSAGAGVLGALLAVLFAHGVRLARGALAGVPELVRPAAGGLALGLLALLSPFALTYGKHQVELALALPSAAACLLALVAKLAGTSLTLGAGWRGGFIIPLFFVGAAAARACHLLVPALDETLLACTLMVALNTGVTKTPLGSTLVVSRMAGLQLVPFAGTAAVVAWLLTQRTHVLEAQREREVGRRAA